LSRKSQKVVKAVKKMSKSCQQVVKKMYKSCQKVVKKLSKKLSKSCQIYQKVKILKRVGGGGGGEGDLQLLDQVRPCRTW
jgi:uncharacterized protein YoxC